MICNATSPSNAVAASQVIKSIVLGSYVARSIRLWWINPASTVSFLVQTFWEKRRMSYETDGSGDQGIIGSSMPKSPTIQSNTSGGTWTMGRIKRFVGREAAYIAVRKWWKYDQWKSTARIVCRQRNTNTTRNRGFHSGYRINGECQEESIEVINNHLIHTKRHECWKALRYPMNQRQRLQPSKFTKSFRKYRVSFDDKQTTLWMIDNLISCHHCWWLHMLSSADQSNSSIRYRLPVCISSQLSASWLVLESNQYDESLQLFSLTVYCDSRAQNITLILSCWPCPAVRGSRYQARLETPLWGSYIIPGFSSVLEQDLYWFRTLVLNCNVNMRLTSSYDL